MFILDGYVVNSWKRIDITENKKDIINDMIDISNKYGFYNYRITEISEGVEFPPERITDQKEFSEYLVKYRERIKPLEDMSCIDLKRYILGRKNKK